MLPSKQDADCGIYRIVFSNGKAYIGQSIAMSRRYKDHIKDSAVSPKMVVHDAMRKHEYTFEILCNCQEQELNALEKLLIAEHKTLSPYGYNLTDGGYGGRATPDVIEKLRLAGLGRAHTPETCRKIKEALTGKPKSPEHAQKIRNKTLSPATRKLISDKRKGQKLPPERLEKLITSNIGLKRSQETLEKMAAAQRGKTRSPETHAALARGRERYWAEYRAKKEETQCRT